MVQYIPQKTRGVSIYAERRQNMPNLKVGIVSQARMGSTRLPGKVLLDAAGRPLLAYHIDRLSVAGAPVYLAITDQAIDDPLAAWAVANRVPFVRGSTNDVLDRYGLAASMFGLDLIVRVTSDCPLIDGQLIAEGISHYLAQFDSKCYLSNVQQRTFPRGMDFEIFSRGLLDLALAEATRPHEREHVTPFFYATPKPSVHMRHITQDRDDSRLRLTVDELADFELIRTLIERYEAADLNSRALADLLYAHPELEAMNAHVSQKQLSK
jgi:spore coat polysaccharide biosynthesis protein SpsF